MQKCEEIKILLSAYFDDELNAHEKDLVDGHLSTCPACREELATLKNVSRLLRGIEKENAPAEFAQKVSSRIENRNQLDGFLKGLFKKENVKAPLAFAFAAVLLFVFVQPMLLRNQQGRSKLQSDEIGEQYSPGAVSRYKEKSTGAKKEDWMNSYEYAKPAPSKMKSDSSFVIQDKEVAFAYRGKDASSAGLASLERDELMKSNSYTTVNKNLAVAEAVSSALDQPAKQMEPLRSENVVADSRVAQTVASGELRAIDRRKLESSSKEKWPSDDKALNEFSGSATGDLPARINVEAEDIDVAKTRLTQVLTDIGISSFEIVTMESSQGFSVNLNVPKTAYSALIEALKTIGTGIYVTPSAASYQATAQRLIIRVTQSNLATSDTKPFVGTSEESSAMFQSNQVK